MKDTARCPRCGGFLFFGTDGNGRVVESCPTCELNARRRQIAAERAERDARRGQAWRGESIAIKAAAAERLALRQRRGRYGCHEDREVRDRAIIAAYLAGASARAVGIEYGLTGMRVLQILAAHGVETRLPGSGRPRVPVGA